MFLQFSGPRYETDTKRSSSGERKFRTKFVGGNGSVVVRVIGRKFGDELQRRARDIDTRVRSGGGVRLPNFHDGCCIYATFKELSTSQTINLSIFHET